MLRWRHRVAAVAFDQDLRSASDYALILKDLPPNTVKEDIIRHFSQPFFLEGIRNQHSTMGGDSTELGMKQRSMSEDPFVHEMCIPLFDVREVVIKV